MLAEYPLTLARELLQDETATYRWANSTLYRYLGEGVRRVYTARADARFDEEGNYLGSACEVPAMSGETLPTVALPLPEHFAMALTHYVCYLAFLNDTDDPVNSRRAQEHLALHNLEVQRS